jgi:hypothetical protein
MLPFSCYDECVSVQNHVRQVGGVHVDASLLRTILPTAAVAVANVVVGRRLVAAQQSAGRGRLYPLCPVNADRDDSTYHLYD